MPRAGSRRRSSGGEDTRRKLLDAALSLLTTRGFAEATARNIGEEAGCNPALVFYHYGTLNELLLAALDASSDAALERYRTEMAQTKGIREVLEVAARLHRVDQESGHVHLVAQMVAGGVVDRELGREVVGRIEPWVTLTRSAMARALPAVARRRLPVNEMAYMVVATALGAELLSILSGDPGRTQAALDRLTRNRWLVRGLFGGETTSTS